MINGMKKIGQLTVLIPSLLLAAVFLFSSCRKDEGPYTDGKVSLTLKIGTQGDLSVSTRAGENVLPYEGIRTLRVIVVSPEGSAGGRRILYNVKHTVDSDPAPGTATLETELQLENVPAGIADIYVIGNEESIIDGDGYTDEVLEGDRYKEDEKLLVLDEDWTRFPARYEEIAAHGLPMSGKLEGADIQANSDISIQLVRAAVKINLTVENATSGNLTLKWVRLGKFISDRVFMFRRDGTSLDIPEDTQHTDKQYGSDNEPLGVNLAQGQKTDWSPVYIFPNYAYRDQTGPNPYTLALATDRKDYEASQFASDLNAMVRNTQFNITARITASANIEISYTQVPWTKIEIEIPAFD